MVDRLSPLPHEDNNGSPSEGEGQSNAASQSSQRPKREDARHGNHAKSNNRNKPDNQNNDRSQNKRHSKNNIAKPNKPNKARFSKPNKTIFNKGSKSSASTAVNRNASYAALDLGTNNCRLLIAKPDRDGFKIIDAFSRVVRLGEGLAKSGRISDKAMDRAVDALAICAQKLKRRNVILSRSVATEACRQAVNGVEFIERVRKETGIVLDIIPSEEEARLAVLGCHVLLPKGKGPALIFDIGGGSTELVLVSTHDAIPEIIEWVSIPWGVVTLTESETIKEDSEQARIKAYDNMRKRVRESFKDFGDRLPQSGDFRTLGTSGTITTLASVYLELPYYNRNKVDGIHVPADAMRTISQSLAAKSPYERSLLPCIGEQRSDLVVAGCAILESILDIWPADKLGVADRGIREGILRSLMNNNGRVSLRTEQ